MPQQDLYFGQRDSTRPQGSGIMSMLDQMKKGVNSSAGVTSSMYQGQRDEFTQALNKAKSSMPLNQMYGSPMANQQMNQPVFGQNLYDAKVPPIK